MGKSPGAERDVLPLGHDVHGAPVLELRRRRCRTVAMMVARGPVGRRRRIWRRSEDTLERQTSAGVRGEAPEADVVEQNVLGVDQRVWIRRGVRSEKLAASARSHRSDGSVEPLPELEHLSLRLEREANLAPAVHLARAASDREHGEILPERSPGIHPGAASTVEIGRPRTAGRNPSTRSAPIFLDGEARAHALS